MCKVVDVNLPLQRLYTKDEVVGSLVTQRTRVVIGSRHPTLLATRQLCVPQYAERKDQFNHRLVLDNQRVSQAEPHSTSWLVPLCLSSSSVYKTGSTSVESAELVTFIDKN